MNFKKKIVKNILIQTILAFIAFLYICFVRLTSKIYHKNISIPSKYWQNKRPFILLFWHSQLLLINYCWKNNQKLNILASGHSDGQFGATVGKFLGINNVTISDKKKKVNIRTVFDLIKNDKFVGISPDGPRGPREKVSAGVIKIAKQAKVPVIPVGFWSSNNFTLNSWDSFLVTKPFSKCVFYWSEPIEIPENLEDKDIIKFQKIIETKINNCVDLAKKNLSA